jgi:hypothetical protein
MRTSEFYAGVMHPLYTLVCAFILYWYHWVAINDNLFVFALRAHYMLNYES